jgi:hypothetical protein
MSRTIADHCPEVKWIASYAVLAPCDYVDIFEAPDNEAATQVSALVRIYGCADSQVWPALEWSSFKRLLSDLPEPPGASARASARRTRIRRAKLVVAYRGGTLHAHHSDR